MPPSPIGPSTPRGPRNVRVASAALGGTPWRIECDRPLSYLTRSPTLAWHYHDAGHVVSAGAVPGQRIGDRNLGTVARASNRAWLKPGADTIEATTACGQMAQSHESTAT